MARFISKDAYNRYRDKVWQLTNAKQRYEPGKPHRGLSDIEIADRLGLRIEEVTEIRCIAENEMTSLKNYLGAEGIKEKRYRRAPHKK